MHRLLMINFIKPLLYVAFTGIAMEESIKQHKWQL